MRLVIVPVLIASLLVGCGKDRGKDEEDSTTTDNSGDAEAEDAPDRDEALLAELETAQVAACHEEGYLFERRKLTCSDEIMLATSFACDRAGIREAFAPTGFQIDVALDDALGKEGDEGNVGDGFSLDQCGETEDGRLLVHFVKRGKDGKIVVREIETQL